MTNASLTEEPTYCAVHPDRETGLRCNRCGRYMCAQCAVSTPIGYRCRECVRQVEDKFFTGTSTDNIVAFGVPVVVTGIAAFIGAQFGILSFWLIGFFAGVVYGGVLSQLLLTMLGKRKGRYTAYIASAGVVLGTAVGLVLTGVLAGLPFDIAARIYLVNLGVWIFAGVTVSVLYGRFR